MATKHILSSKAMCELADEDAVGVDAVKRLQILMVEMGAAWCTEEADDIVDDPVPFVGRRQRVTHVVMPDLAPGALVVKSWKHFVALCTGAWIVSMSWLTESLRAKRWLPEADFEVGEFEARTRRTLQQSLGPAGEGPRLAVEGYNFMFALAHDPPTPGVAATHRKLSTSCALAFCLGDKLPVGRLADRGIIEVRDMSYFCAPLLLKDENAGSGNAAAMPAPRQVPKMHPEHHQPFRDPRKVVLIIASDEACTNKEYMRVLTYLVSVHRRSVVVRSSCLWMLLTEEKWVPMRHFFFTDYLDHKTVLVGADITKAEKRRLGIIRDKSGGGGGTSKDRAQH